MPYRLPPPWDPGFALPGNVLDEGLERRAFVTKQARRGTYDDPKVGTGGYVVPQYVKDEGYGRGVFTTAWPSSGSTPGVRVPNYLNQRPQVVAAAPAKGGGTAYVVARKQSVIPAAPTSSAVAFGDVPPNSAAIPAVYRRYGQRAATAVLKNAARVAQPHRGVQMKQTLDAIDPKLWPRAVKAAKATGNVHAGLAHAFSVTLLEQVVQTGKSGTAPKKGLMGLAGCARGRGVRTAMGALPPVALKNITPVAFRSLLTKFIPNAVTGSGGITAGTCTSDGQFIWDAGGFWRRKMAGETCASISSATTDVRTHASGSGGGVTVTTQGGTPVQANLDASPIVTPGTTKLITVGPFTFPLVDRMNIHWSGLLPDDWRAALNKQLARDCSPCIETSMRDASAGSPYAGLRNFLGPEMPSKINHDFVSVNPGGPLSSSLAVQWLMGPDQPIVTTHRPDNGEHWGLWMYLEPVKPGLPFDATTNPWNLRLQWREVHDGVWSWIWDVISTIGDWAEDAINAIGSLTCDILSNPAGQVGAVAGGAVIGGPGGAQAGAAGAKVGAQVCAQPPPAVVETGSGLGLPLAIAGVGIAAALLLTKKKRSP